MKRKTSIIISITGITIIVLILLGFTYGYYLTSIIGNTNSKSVSITTGDMSVLYTDMSVEPLSVIIEPGYETIKLFTVQNTGNTKAIYSIYLSEVQNNFVRTDDITYILYRKSGNDTIDVSDLSDCEVVATGVFPKTNAFIKTNEIIETPNDYYTYALKITYVNSTENQDVDQGHTFGGIVQISSTYDSPFSEGTLADAIFDNSINLTTEEKTAGYASFVVPTSTTPAEEISTEDESILSIANDDLGVSYYYRGNVKSNYVNFAGMCWRVVRIAGDGSIKLTLEDQDQECSSSMNGNFDIASAAYGYTYDSTTETDKINYLNYEGGMADGLESFQTNKLSSVTGKLKAGDWCYDGTTYQDAAGLIPLEDTSSYYTNGTSFYYGAYTRLNNLYKPSLGCAGEKMNAYRTGTTMYVGALTADEVVYAGGKAGSSNEKYYLVNDYQKENYIYWLTLSPSDFDGRYYNAFSVYDYGSVDFYGVSYDDSSVRPAVSLISGVEINGGDGSIDNPYTIK